MQQVNDIYELIDKLGRSNSLAVASNRLPQDWYSLFSTPVLAQCILDRLINKAHPLIMTGKRYHPPTPS